MDRRLGRIVEAMNPIEWCSWLYGKMGNFGLIVILIIAFGFVSFLWSKGVEKYKKDNQDTASSAGAQINPVKPQSEEKLTDEQIGRILRRLVESNDQQSENLKLDEILDGVMLIMPPTTSRTLFPMKLELRSSKSELRAVQASMTIVKIGYEGNRTILKLKLIRGFYTQLIPMGVVADARFEPPVRLVDKEGERLEVLTADLVPRFTFALPGQSGRFWIEGRFKLITPPSYERRWELVTPLQRGKVEPDTKPTEPKSN